MSEEKYIIYDEEPEKEDGGSEEEEKPEGTIIEAQIINTILNNRSMSIITSNSLDSSYFPGYSDEFTFIRGHFIKYNKVPDITTFLDRYPDFPVFDVDESEQAMIFTIKEAKGYSMVAPALRQIDEIAKTNSIEAARAMKDKAEKILQEISLVRFSKGQDIFKEADLRYQEYIRRMEMQDKLGCTFGIKSFDEATGGVWQNDFLGIVGRPGQGKSWILEYLLLQPWRMQKKKILLFSLENPKEIVGFRADSLLAHFSNFGLVTGKEVLNWENNLPTKTWEDYREYISGLSQYETPFEVLDSQDSLSGVFTVEDILEIAEQRKPDILAIDQLSLIAADKRFRNIREGYIHTTRTIRQAVNKLGIPIYLNCQAGREASKISGKSKENTPELHQIAESDSVGQDATKILSIYNSEGILKISLKKNTNGRSNLDSIMAWDIDLGMLRPASVEDLQSPAEKF